MMFTYVVGYTLVDGFLSTCAGPGNQSVIFQLHCGKIAQDSIRNISNLGGCTFSFMPNLGSTDE